MTHNGWAKALLFCFAATFTGTTLHGQGGSVGTILGTVTDNTGAVVPGADVEVFSVETGVSQKLKTSASGDYAVPYLHPGVYRVTVQAPGFQKSAIEGITLTVDQKAREDVSLQVGAATQTVEVSTGQVALDTDTAEVAQVVSPRQVLELPLNSRNFVALLFLTPGAVQTGGESGGNTASSGTRGNGAISINGGRSSSNQYLIDGMYNNDTIFQGPAINPSVDAIQEFKVQSGAYSAEFGNSANQVNIGFLSGTNNFHGTAFEFNRNDGFDAYSAFTDKTQPKALLRQNQFGYTLGGPVWIPKIYDGRNRTFFFANYEGLRLHQKTSFLSNVPSAAEQGIGTPGGDALIAPSTLACAGTAGCALVDPANGYAPFGTDGAGNYVIPAGRFSNWAVQNINGGHIPAANVTGSATNNYQANVPNPTTADQQNYRFDETLGSKESFFFRYSRADYNQATLPGGINAEGLQSNIYQERSYQGSYTHTFSPTLINQFRLGYLKSDAFQVAVQASQADIDALHITGVYKSRTWPTIEWDAPAIYGQLGGAANLPNNFSQPTWDLTDTLSWNLGRHSLVIGINWRHLTLNDESDAANGIYHFNGSFSNSPIGDFLLGNANSAQAASPTPYSTGNAGAVVQIPHWFVGPFIQDNIRISPKLTVNAGLRYDFQSVPYNTSHQFGWFDPTVPGGGLDVADKSLIDKGLGGTIYKYAGGDTPFAAQKLVFAPRLGFAYRVNEQTVVRGGYGVFFDSSEDSETHQFGQFYPYSVRNQLTATRQQGNLLQMDNLFPPITNLGAVTPSILGFLLTQVNKKSNPYIQEWDMSVERQLSGNTVIEVNYSGNKGNHLLGRNSVNQPYAFDPANPGFNASDPASVAASKAARTPFSNFGQTILADSFAFRSNYHAGTVKVQTNQHGLNLLALYTYSKSMDEKSAAAGVDGDAAGWASTEDPHNVTRDYARSSYDVGNRFVASFLYDLPVGKGKALDVKGPLNIIAGGWQVNAIVTLQGGFPFSVVAGDPTGLLGNNYSQRANQTGPIRLLKTRNEWFDRSSFSHPSYTNPADGNVIPGGVYGDSSRNSVRAPGISNWDSSIFKNFDFAEKAKLQMRLETFNTFNHTELGFPITNIDSVDPKGNSNAGFINSVRIPGRILQLGAKIIF